MHIGLALDARLEEQAQTEAARNSRYHWLGERPHWKTRQILARSDLAVITSRMEGSSNVLSEALASSVPVVASKIPGLMGTLGKSFPGYFPVGNTQRLTALLQKSESDKKFYRRLKRHCEGLSYLVHPSASSTRGAVCSMKLAKQKPLIHRKPRWVDRLISAALRESTASPMAAKDRRASTIRK